MNAAARITNKNIRPARKCMNITSSASAPSVQLNKQSRLATAQAAYLFNGIFRRANTGLLGSTSAAKPINRPHPQQAVSRQIG
jgi:hypothetical protein